jgi:hypothetical protein
VTKLVKKVELVPEAQEMAGEDLTPTVGQWYWIKTGDDRRLGCVSKVGSNFIAVTHVSKHKTYQRFHFDQFFDVFEREDNPDAVIDGEVARCQNKVRELMGQVTELTNRLAVSPRTQLAEPPPETMALSRISSGQSNLEDYKTALVKAQKETLPDLFKSIKAANEEMAVWMSAKTLPLEALSNGMHGVIKKVEDRIFNIELYAGLTETATQFAEGEPALFNEKLHLMQRRCYMDEECLANYRSGGMDFEGIAAFDQWLAEPENRDRILPFPRCIVSFRVRRIQKERNAVSLRDIIRFTALEEADKATFLYLRNGENLFRIRTKLDFGEKLFPDHEQAMLTEDLMFAVFGSSVGDFITRRAYDELVKEDNIKRAEREAENEARKARGESTWTYHSTLDRWQPFHPDNIYYDEMKEKVAKAIAQYNRIALILQGLFDRSPVFDPHPPVKTWSPESFERFIKLVFDDDKALHAGEKPDFQAYFARLNKLLKPGDVTVGQEKIWLRREAEKENDKIERSWNRRNDMHYKEYRPYGNPGPGILAVPATLGRKYATFKWTRQRLIRRWSSDSKRIPVTLRVPKSKLFNVSAYQPGDYKQFFEDPRTRLEYIKWAPLLLTAEDYHAGDLKVRDEDDEFTTDGW